MVFGFLIIPAAANKLINQNPWGMVISFGPKNLRVQSHWTLQFTSSITFTANMLQLSIER